MARTRNVYNLVVFKEESRIVKIKRSGATKTCGSCIFPYFLFKYSNRPWCWNFTFLWFYYDIDNLKQLFFYCFFSWLGTFITLPAFLLYKVLLNFQRNTSINFTRPEFVLQIKKLSSKTFRIIIYTYFPSRKSSIFEVNIKIKWKFSFYVWRWFLIISVNFELWTFILFQLIMYLFAFNK